MGHDFTKAFDTFGETLPTLAQLTHAYVKYVMDRCLYAGKPCKSHAAEVLGVNRRTLYRRKDKGSIADTVQVNVQVNR